MLTVYYKNENGYILRPTPLVSINQTANRNEVSSLGSTYSITLSGAIIASEGSPVYSGPNGKPSVESHMRSEGPNWTDGGGIQRVDGTSVPYGEKLGSIINKQTVIRELFAMDGQKMELSSISNNEAKLVFFPVVESITFDEGPWVDICRYTVNLVATALLKEDGTLVADSQPYLVDSLELMHEDNPEGQSTAQYQNNTGSKEKDILDSHGGFVSDYSDTWSIEPDEGLATSDDNGNIIPLGYRLTRNMTATGVTKYIADFTQGDTAKPKKYDAWQMAKGFLKKSVLKDNGADGSEDYPNYGQDGLAVYASGFLDLEGYTGFNSSRTESIDIAAGTYSIEDSWTIASGVVPAYEQFDMSVSTETGSAFVAVNVNGTIRGASSVSVADRTKPEPVGQTRYDRASDKYYQISNNGQFGIGSTIYKRANGCCEQVLNSQPASLSLSTNEFTGEISYSITFDNRPTNIFTGVMSESIVVNDTMPGDVYASIPVLGRKTGPVLQYMDMRTEYKRSLNIEMQLDYTDIGYGSSRNNLLLTKPTVRSPLKNEIDSVIREVSPANEPGIRKYFIDPPTENWNPRTGSYSLSLSWTYELDN